MDLQTIKLLRLEKGGASWDNKINVLAVTAQQIAANSGQIEAETLEAFIQQVTKENLVDLIMAIGIITVTIFFHNVTDVPIDFQ
jgi:hypothetical protein